MIFIALVGVLAYLVLLLWCLLASAERQDRRMAREWERWR